LPWEKLVTSRKNLVYPDHNGSNTFGWIKISNDEKIFAKLVPFLIGQYCTYLRLMQVPDFQRGYGDFLNKLMTHHFIPLSAIGKDASKN
jgi:hypothetical protein